MRYFDDPDVRRQVNIEFANISNEGEEFHDVDSLRGRGKIDAKIWWTVHGARAPILQKK